MQFKETSQLYSSHLFQLQIQQLLSQIQLNTSSSDQGKELQKFLLELKSILLSSTQDSSGDKNSKKDFLKKNSTFLENGHSFKEVQAFLKKHNVEMPFFKEKAGPGDDSAEKESKLHFKFLAPHALHIIGSFLLQAWIKEPSSSKRQYIDLAVQMPSNLFQEKDFLNYRYTQKRAYYLSVLAALLKKSHLNLDLEFELFQQDEKRPVLILTTTPSSPFHFSHGGKMGPQWAIRIFPTVGPDVFTKLSKLGPLRNNLRHETAQLLPSVPQEEWPSTSHYNNSILMDTGFLLHLNFLHHHLKNCASLKEAIILGKVWTHQRFSSYLKRGFNGFLFSMIMGYLLQSTSQINGHKRLSNEFSSYQLFKVTLEFLATHDFKMNPIVMTPDGQPIEADDFSLKAFQRKFDVVILDPTGRINLGAYMTEANLDEVHCLFDIRP